jgi:hypothetical protein
MIVRYYGNSTLPYRGRNITGEIEVHYAHVNKLVTFLTPNCYGEFSVFYGFAFSEASGLDYIPFDEIDLLRKMVACEFLDMIITSRSQVKLTADYNRDTGDLIDKRDNVKVEVDKALSDQVIYPFQWG